MKTMNTYLKKSDMPWQILNVFFKVRKTPKPNQNKNQPKKPAIVSNLAVLIQ